MQVDLHAVEEAARELYIRALKRLPPDIKEGFNQLSERESGATAREVLGTMITNIQVAESNNNLLCQDTGIPIYDVTIGQGVQVDGYALKQAIRTGCERATREHPLRSSVVHPLTRENNHSSSGIQVPVIHIDFSDTPQELTLKMVPKGSGSENNSFLKMAIPAEGINAIRSFVVDCVVNAGGKTCPPTIVGVGLGGTSDLCVALAKRGCNPPSGQPLQRPGRGPAGGGTVHGDQPPRHRPPGTGGRFNRLRRPCGAGPYPHHHEPDRGEHAVPFGPPRHSHLLATRHDLGILIMAHYQLKTPVSEAQIRQLRVNDTVTLEQTLFGIRDATQIHLFDRGRRTRFDLRGHAVIHTAPNVRRVDPCPEYPAGYAPVCIGTTTSDRMERFTHPLMSQCGVRMIIGKGGMRQGSLDAFQALGGVYLAIVGGTAALETTWIEQIEEVDMDDLNPESLWKFRIRNFGPLLVAMDSHGNSLYDQVRNEVALNRSSVLESLGVEPS